MPRQVTRRPSDRPQVDINSHPEQLRTYAGISPIRIHSSALAAADALNGLVDVSRQVQARREQRDQVSANASFVNDSPDTPAEASAKSANQSSAFQRTYMELYGYRKGSEIEAQLNSAWDHGTFDRENGDINAFVNQTVGEQLKGLDDPHALASANQVIERARAQLVAKHAQYNAQRVEEGVVANAGNLIDMGLKDGSLKTPEGRDAIYAKLRASGLENREIDGLLVQRVTSAGDLGDPSVYDAVLKRNPNGEVVGHRRADGTPGIFDIPAYNTKLKEGLYRAELRQMELFDRTEAYRKKELKDIQEKTSGDLWSAAFQNENISNDLEAARKDHRISTEEYVSISKFRQEAANNPDIADNDQAVVDLEDAIYNKRAHRPNVIAAWNSGDISRKTLTRMFELVDKVNNRKEYDVFDTDRYKFAQDFVDGHLAPGMMDIDRSVKSRLTANAKRELRDRVLKGEDPYVVSTDIVKRYGKPDTPGTLPQPTFKTREELVNAFKAKQVSAEVFARDMRIFNLRETPTPQPTQ